MPAGRKIQLPNNWRERPYQAALWDHLISGGKVGSFTTADCLLLPDTRVPSCGGGACGAPPFSLERGIVHD